MAAVVRLVVSTLLVAAMAGCVVGEASPTSQDDGPDAPSFDDDKGSIHGFILDSEQSPLVRATVGVVETSQTTTTSGTGEYTLNDVKPGNHTLTALALGYEATSRKVDVFAGQVVEANLLLEPIPLEVSYPNIQIVDGYVACSVRAYPGAPLGGALAYGWYTGVAVCGLPVVNNTLGDKFLLNWKISKGTQELTLEMEWRTTQAAGRGLGVIVEYFESANNGKPTFGTASGPSPLVVYANETKFLNVTEAIERDCFERACQLTTRVFGEANTTEFYLPTDLPSVGPFGKPRNKVDAGVVIDQQFTQYLTTFHYMTRPPEFTALPDT